MGHKVTDLIDAEMSFYGDYVQINEQVVLQNQENVLNEAALVLGIALRQTEDELTRNMLASTASAINCTGGVNGDNPEQSGVVKSFLIDLDTLASYLVGNKAQASFGFAA